MGQLKNLDWKDVRTKVEALFVLVQCSVLGPSQLFYGPDHIASLFRLDSLTIEVVVVKCIISIPKEREKYQLEEEKKPSQFSFLSWKIAEFPFVLLDRVVQEVCIPSLLRQGNPGFFFGISSQCQFFAYTHLRIYVKYVHMHGWGVCNFILQTAANWYITLLLISQKWPVFFPGSLTLVFLFHPADPRGVTSGGLPGIPTQS